MGSPSGFCRTRLRVAGSVPRNIFTHFSRALDLSFAVAILPRSAARKFSHDWYLRHWILVSRLFTALLNLTSHTGRSYSSPVDSLRLVIQKIRTLDEVFRFFSAIAQPFQHN